MAAGVWSRHPDRYRAEPIESEPRCFNAVLHEGQILVLNFVGAQLLMPSDYNIEIT